MPSIERFQTSDGRVRHRARVRLTGFPDESRTFAKRVEALAWALAREETLKLQTPVRQVTEGRPTRVNDLIDRYAAHISAVNKSGEQYAKILANLQPLTAPLTLESTALDFLDVREQLIQRKLKHDTINKYMNLLKHSLQMGVEAGVLSNNPMAGIKQLPASKPRDRYLSSEEIQRLLKYCAHYQLYRLIIVALNTGMRKSELLQLKYADVNFNRQEITLRDTKNKHPRIVPMNEAVLSAIRSNGRPPNPNHYVFYGRDPFKPFDHRRAWETTRECARLQDVHFHDLRHTAASHWSMAGCTPLEVAQILGHKSLKSTERYSHLSIDHLHTIVDNHTVT